MPHNDANQRPVSPVRADDTKSVVTAILDQIPELTRVTQVKKRHGGVVAFDTAQVALSFAEALKEIGINDSQLLARCTHQALMRLDRDFDGHAVPTTDDVSRVIAGVLIDNNLSYGVKKYFAALAAGDVPPRPAIRHPGLRFRRWFTRKGVHPYDEIAWEMRDAVIRNEKGKAVFEQLGIETPEAWSQQATNICASKYFRGQLGMPEREDSVRQMVDRVAKTITGWGRHDGYFASDEDAGTFSDELTFLLVNQHAAFNSPVWFNVGVNPRPQCSACFINSVRDDMRSILNLSVTEGMLFKYGSGTGSNLSTLRSSKEMLSNSSGKSSGPVSFMKGFDAFAGIIKSGGKTRRAAKMVILNVDHPDIEEFITCKVKEERKGKALISLGYDGSIDGDAYASVFFQNANNSVRVTDEFMRAVVEGREWRTRAVTTGAVVETMPARELMSRISEAAWECGDPGLQYDTTVNRWHTCPNSGRVNASNPCVTGDTLVATAHGWQRIDVLLKKPSRVIGADGRLHEVQPAFSTGVKPVYRLTTKAGFELKLTADHRVSTANRGDVPAAELTKDDVLLLGRPSFGTAKLDERLGEFLGLLVGDGCLSGGQETAIVTLSPDEKAVAQRVHRRLADYRGEHAADGRAARASEVRQPQGTLRFGTSARCVVEPAKELAVLDAGSDKKSFRPGFFALDRASLAAILRGLFTADGTVANYGEKSQYVSLDSSSSELLRQVQLVLLAFGIKAKIYRDRRVAGQATALLPDGQSAYKEYPIVQMRSLRVSRGSRVVFEKEIGFLPGSRKAELLTALNREVTAYEDRFEDRPAGLEYLGEEAVYDLTEPVTAHFVAGGLVVHNCSEYMFLDDTACNLASLNLMKFRTPDGGFDVSSFSAAVETMIAAMDILVSNSSYPTPAIEQNSEDFRPLGLGYANLGALLMSRGLAYDSDDGRNFAAAVTALMSGQAYAQSAAVAQALEPFRFYKLNERPFLKVIGSHRDKAYALAVPGVPQDLADAAKQSWDTALERGMANGFRNAQISVLAPTGTIGFLMDCDTTGIEPDIALVKYKWLVGGGLMKIVNQTVPEALTQLGYEGQESKDILAYLDREGTIEGAPHLKPEHLPVFDCAFRPAKGSRCIDYMGHIRMMAAVQPFLSGAISKTVNMPCEATPKDIENAYVESWKLGLKAVAIYRDGSKGQQVLTTTADKDGKSLIAIRKLPLAISDSPTSVPAPATPTASGDPRFAISDSPPPAPEPQVRIEYRPLRRRLPDERRSLTHKFSVAGHEGYITVGLYDDGTPGEFFIRMAKGGSVIAGLMDAFATSTSIALQYGVPLKVLVNKFVHVRFEPSGFTNHPNIRIAKSIVDYIFRWLAIKFLPPEEARAAGVNADIQTVGDAGQASFENGGVMVPEMPNASCTPACTPTADNPAIANGESRMANRESPAAVRLPFDGASDRSQGSNALTMGFDNQADAPVCDTCGAMMIRNGACYKCLNCGSTSGCS